MNLHFSASQWRLLIAGVALAALVIGLIVYQSFELAEADNMWDAITGAPDWQNILFVDALIGVSVVLFILELRGDSMRILLTVGMALLFGFFMTAFFNLDAADKFVRGNFEVRILSDDDSPVDLSYEQDISGAFNNPDDPITEGRYSFLGAEGDKVTILAYAIEPESGLDMQVALLDESGAVVAEATEADRRVQKQYGDYVQSETDAAMRDVVLPADGLYTILAQPEGDTELQAEFGVALLSDHDSAAGLIYNGQAVEDIFNREGDTDPLKQVDYTFIGGEGDTVTLLAYAKRANVPVDLEVILYDEAGNKLAENFDANDEQVEAYEELKSTRDSIIESFVLPATASYRIHVQPQPLDLSTKLDETLDETVHAYDAFLLGPLSKLNRWMDWQRDAITLIMLGLAIAIVFRAEQFSLGAEGQLYLGALVAGVIGLSFGDVPRALLVPIALFSAATVGFLWGLLPGALKAYLDANELVSTLMLNTIAVKFYEMVITDQLTPPDAGFSASDWIPENGLLAPVITVEQNSITIAIYILIALILFSWLLIQRTPLGYEIRMIGANIKFADYGGVNTKRTIMLAMAISGAVAGLAGAHLALGVHRKLLLTISIGLAFEGVVVALLARNNPLVVPFTGLLYAYLRAGAQIMEREANISAEVVRIIQAVVILLITAEALVTFFQQRQVRRRGSGGESGDKQDRSLTPAEGGVHG
ncbi:MAG: ABC transporter permease [Anaerolineae bacterium]|nr:ABC transporter permease [Anaerolineae bacterium]